MTWTKPDFDNPPHHTMVGLSDDGCSSAIIVKLDDGSWVYAEDGESFHFFNDFLWWTPAPADFRPHFMEITNADWY